MSTSELESATVSRIRATPDIAALAKLEEVFLNFNAAGKEIATLVSAAPSDPALIAQPATVELTSATPTQELKVESSTGAPVPFNVSVNPASPWLTATPSSGVTPTSVVLSVFPGSAPGAGSGSISITSPQAIEDVNVPVSATSGAGPVTITVTPPRIDADSTLGGSQITRTLQVAIQGGTLGYSVGTDSPWITAAAQGQTVTVTLNPAGRPTGDSTGNVIITSSGAVNSPLRIPVLLRIGPPTTAPFIRDAGSAATYQSALTSPNTWIAIFGNNLANAPGREWRTDEIVGGRLPTNLDGTSVTVNGKPAFVYFVSPGQVNVLTPAETARGPVTIQVTKDGTVSNAFIANLQAYLPGLLLKHGSYIAARHLDGTLVGNQTFPGTEPATPAKPGEVISLYGTGLGETAPPSPSGLVVPSSPLHEVTLPVSVLINGVAAQVLFKGLTPTQAGLYLINVRVPESLTAGDKSVVVEVGGVRSPANFALLPVQP